MSEIKFQTSSLKGIEIKKCLNSQHSYKEHLHQELSMGYIEKGSTVLNINGKNYHIEENEGIFISPFISHRCQPKDINNWKFTMIYIHKDYLKEINVMNQKNFIKIKKLDFSDVIKLKTLMDTLSGKGSLFDKENALVSVLINFLDNYNINLDFQQDFNINKVKEYIKNNFLKEITLDYLQSKYKINKFMLIREFKLKYNTTPSAYQLQLKTDYSKQLINKNNNFADIALESGFYDQAHFSKEFKKAYGITPLNYYKSLNH